MYRQTNERAGISIEQGTSKVPNDTKFYVLKDDQIVGSYRSFKQADAVYKKLVAEKNLPPLERKPIQKSTREILQDDWNLRSNKALLGGTWSSKGQKSGRYHKSR
jgi:hypothetical protein